jgi:hypothetical protein
VTSHVASAKWLVERILLKARKQSADKLILAQRLARCKDTALRTSARRSLMATSPTFLTKR